MTTEIEPILQDFYKKIEAKNSTREVYGHAINHYSTMQGMGMEELLEEAETDMMEKLPPRKQRLLNRLINFNEMLSSTYSPNTKGIYMGAVKSFYRTYGVIIPKIGNSKRKSLIKQENRWKGFNRDDISRHLKAHLTLRDRAIILLICTSGISKKEIRNLKRKDFEEGQDSDDVTTFTIRRNKTEYDYYTFCTPEATKAINDYLKTRKDDSPYLFVSRNKTKISKSGWGWIFKNLNERLGIDRDGKQFSQTRSHNYRKYFQTTLQNNKFPIWLVDFMMAHDTSEVRKYYYDADPVLLKDIYKEYMHLLAIDDLSFELMKDDEIKRILSENRELKHNNDEIVKRISALSKTMLDMDLRYTQRLHSAGLIEPDEIEDIRPMLESDNSVGQIKEMQ